MLRRSCNEAVEVHPATNFAEFWHGRLPEYRGKILGAARTSVDLARCFAMPVDCVTPQSYIAALLLPQILPDAPMKFRRSSWLQYIPWDILEVPRIEVSNLWDVTLVRIVLTTHRTEIQNSAYWYPIHAGIQHINQIVRTVSMPLRMTRNCSVFPSLLLKEPPVHYAKCVMMSSRDHSQYLDLSVVTDGRNVARHQRVHHKSFLNSW